MVEEGVGKGHYGPWLEVFVEEKVSGLGDRCREEGCRLVWVCVTELFPSFAPPLAWVAPFSFGWPWFILGLVIGIGLGIIIGDVTVKPCRGRRKSRSPSVQALVETTNARTQVAVEKADSAAQCRAPEAPEVAVVPGATREPSPAAGVANGISSTRKARPSRRFIVDNRPANAHFGDAGASAASSADTTTAEPGVPGRRRERARVSDLHPTEPGSVGTQISSDSEFPYSYRGLPPRRRKVVSDGAAD